MPQNISDATGYSTDYDTGIPLKSDDAKIVDAFKSYHYGNGYAGVGDPAGIEGYLRDFQAQIDTFDPLPSQSGNSGKFLSTNGSVPSWETATGGAAGTWNTFTATLNNGWVADTDQSEYYLSDNEEFITVNFSIDLPTGSTFGTTHDHGLVVNLPIGMGSGAPSLYVGTSYWDYSTNTLNPAAWFCYGTQAVLAFPGSSEFTFNNSGLTSAGLVVSMSLTYRADTGGI